jgi:hypothetical protein
MSLDDFLHCGHCEPLKAGVHATALGLFAVMGVYNVAAWLSRRERHLAINAIVYAALTAWERQHVAHHLAELHPAAMPPVEPETALPKLAA